MAYSPATLTPDGVVKIPLQIAPTDLFISVVRQPQQHVTVACIGAVEQKSLDAFFHCWDYTHNPFATGMRGY
jgi:hypothetical protein